MTKLIKDFNLLKLADVSSSSTNTNSVSVVVNADSSGNSQSNNDNQNVNFIPAPVQSTLTRDLSHQPSQSQIFQTEQLKPGEVSFQLTSNPQLQRIQELESQLNTSNDELRFYKLLSSTLSNILKDNNPKLLINLIDQSGKIIIEATTLIELIAIKTNTDANTVNISFKDEEPTCMAKINPIKEITNIKIDNETFSLKYNRAYNIIQDEYNISLDKCIIN